MKPLICSSFNVSIFRIGNHEDVINHSAVTLESYGAPHIRSSLEASIEQFGEQDLSMEKVQEIEAQVRTVVDQFQLKH